ncbi:beta family protein [Enterobacter hormaechei]
MKYFIFLKTKRGDFNTIKTLNAKEMSIVPVFDLTAKVDGNTSPDILKKQEDFFNNITKHWDSKKLFFIDHNDISLTLRHSDGSHPYCFYHKVLSSGFNLGLVTGIDRDAQYQSEVVDLLKSFKNTRVLIRLHIDDITALRLTLAEILDLYSTLIKHTNYVDFIVDNRIIRKDDILIFSKRIEKFAMAIEENKIDCLMIVTSSSFPASIKDYVGTGSTELIPLLELKLWELVSNIELSYASLTYGDYGVVSPDFMEITTKNGKGIPIVPKITYTLEREYVVSRGKITSQHPRGYKQYKDMALYFTSLKGFRANYSFGEKYFARISNMTTNETGNPTTWITACMSQHVNFIYDEID